MGQSKSRVVGAIGLLSDVAGSELFEGRQRPVAERVRQDLLCDHLLHSNVRKHWVLLESLVVFDEILYDGYAFKRHQMPAIVRQRIEQLSPYGLAKAVWPTETYRQTASVLNEWRGFLHARGLAKVARSVPTDDTEPFSSDNDAFWDMQEKDYHDDLFATTDLCRFSFADSEDSFERAMFYAQLARDLKLPLLPRASRYGTLLDYIGRSYSQCAHQVILQHLQPFDATMRPAQLTVAFPPLAEKIVRQSLTQGRPILEIVAELRASPGAVAYRRHMADMQAEIDANRVDLQAVSTLQDAFKETVRKWIEDGSPGEGVRYRTRELRVQVVPAIAGMMTWLASGDFKLAASTAGAANVAAQALFGNTLIVHDPILWNADKFLAFVADWY